ncbi:MAG: TetR/AcrR family transcriptional regulator [Pseudomonadota bacterium]
MARPRNFVEEEVVRAVMMTFWRLGYDATTYRELQKITGLGLRSLSNAFGEKDELFVTVLRAYRVMMKGMLDSFLEGADLEALAQFFEAIAAPSEGEDDIRREGCLMVNSVFELTNMSDPVAAEVTAYRAMFIERFRDVLTQSGVDDVETKAEYLLGSTWGIFSQIRLAKDPVAAQPMARMLADIVRSWAQ